MVPLSTKSPSPLKVSEQPLLLSLMLPARVKTLPAEALTLRLLPSTIAAAIVLLPLSLIVTAPAVFDKVKPPVEDGLMT